MCLHTKPKICDSTRCEQVGIELEGFSDRKDAKGLMGVSGGVWDTDAGINQLELITTPHQSIAAAFSTLEQMLDCEPINIVFTPFRPSHLKNENGEERWQPKIR